MYTYSTVPYLDMVFINWATKVDLFIVNFFIKYIVYLTSSPGNNTDIFII